MRSFLKTEKSNKESETFVEALNVRRDRSGTSEQTHSAWPEDTGQANGRGARLEREQREAIEGEKPFI